jgi:hypothetical protein
MSCCIMHSVCVNLMPVDWCRGLLSALAGLAAATCQGLQLPNRRAGALKSCPYPPASTHKESAMTRSSRDDVAVETTARLTRIQRATASLHIHHIWLHGRHPALRSDVRWPARDLTTRALPAQRRPKLRPRKDVFIWSRAQRPNDLISSDQGQVV